MKLSDIIKEVNGDIDDSYNPADIIRWVNRCIDDLSPIAWMEAHKQAIIIADNNYSLPSDFYQVSQFNVTDSTTNKVMEYPIISISNTTMRGIKMWGNTFQLQNGPASGTIDLYYYRKLNYVADPEDEPEIDTEFHDLFILYASAMSQFYDERPDKENDLLNRYYARKDDFAQYILDRPNHYDDTVNEVW